LSGDTLWAARADCSNSWARDADSGGVTIVFEAGTITVNKENQPVVNENKMTFRRAHIKAGIPR